MTLTAKIAAAAAFWIAIGLVQTFNWGHGVEKAMVMMLLLAAAPFVIAAAHKTPTPLPRWLDRAITMTAALFLVLELVYFGKQIIRPHVIDVALTTLAAGDALLHGGNPYTLPIDTGPESFGFTGYKYLPMMIAAYLPLGAVLGQRGILLTNLALLLACLWLMKRLGRSTLAPFLFLMLPLMPQQIFAKGTTDLVTVLPLLAAFVVFERNSFLAGVCVGLSIAAKPVPGGLFLPCLIPPTERWRYAAGVAVGLMPILPFLIVSPSDLLANTVLFNLSRAPDGTSWMFGAPPAAANAAHVVMVAMFLYAGTYVWRQAPSLATRCGIGAMLTIAAILTGPGAHHNYQLWWLPFYCVVLSRALVPHKLCQETRLRYTSAVGMGTRGT